MKRIVICCLGFWLAGVGQASVAHSAESQQGAHVVSYYGYDDCLRLQNETTRVTLCPASGGRVLEYARAGTNALYLPPGDEGWVYQTGEEGHSPSAGRFDIGPEQTIAAHPQLWLGRWSGKITGRWSVRLTSSKDTQTGVQLTRDFVLDPKSTRLECKQTIRNISNQTREYCHWSRTFAVGGGICLIPLTEPRRFPHGYVMYGPDAAIQFRPRDPQIRMRDGFLEILGAPRYPKLGMDSYAGWFGYLMKNNLLFVKRFVAYPDRVYNEVAGLTTSIWYPDGPMCELEPIGPRERLAAGKSASFTETWWLLQHDYPAEGGMVNLPKLSAQVDQQAPAK